MNEIIKVEETTINNEIVPTVNARDLHEKLEIGRQFANWIQERIEKYGFEEGIDFNKIVKPHILSRDSSEKNILNLIYL